MCSRVATPTSEFRITHIAFSPSGKTLATLGGEDSRMRLWNVASRAFCSGPSAKKRTAGPEVASLFS